MKIYRFHPETGFYLGEDFADGASVKRGEYSIPPDATTIMPPVVGGGEIPVYLVSEQRWTVHSRFKKDQNG